MPGLANYREKGQECASDRRSHKAEDLSGKDVSKQPHKEQK